jgi:hypothetical protein
MKCEECRKRLLDLLSGRLDGESERALADHVAECEACRAEFEDLRLAWDALGALPEDEPGPELSARFYAMLEEAKAEEARAGGPAKRGGFEAWLAAWWPRRPAFQAAAAVVLLAVGLGIGLGIRPDDGHEIEMAVMQAELDNMRQVLTLTLANQTASADRLAAVNSIRKDSAAAQPAVEALIFTMKSDPNVNVRLAAVDALSGYLDRTGVRDEMNRSLEAQTSPMVQVSIIEALSGAEDEQLLQTLRSIAQNEHADPAVREHARKRIEKRL